MSDLERVVCGVLFILALIYALSCMGLAVADVMACDVAQPCGW
jgi:hypothetical protein